MRRTMFPALLAAVSVAAAYADTATVYTNADAFIYEAQPDSTYGTAGWLNAGQQWIGGSESRTLLNFDTSNVIPDGYELVSAVLHTLPDRWVTYAGEATVVATFGVDGTWGETSVTWNSRPTVGSQIGTDTVVVTGSKPGVVSWDVTDAWAESTTLDFYLAMTNPTTATGILQPYSRERG